MDTVRIAKYTLPFSKPVISDYN